MKSLNKIESSCVCGGDNPCDSISVSIGLPPSISVSGTVKDITNCWDYLTGDKDTSMDFIGNEPNAHDPNYTPIEDRTSPVDLLLNSY